MKKLIVLLAALAFGYSAQAGFVTSKTVAGNTMTNLLTLYNGSALVQSITLTSTTATNANGLLVDGTTNLLVYVNPAYSNILSYATNYVQGPLTNYYGGIYYLTNPSPYLIDITNVVASTTNTLNTIGIYAAANTSVTYSPVRYYFEHGIWFTNIGAGAVTVTLQYLPAGY